MQSATAKDAFAIVPAPDAMIVEQASIASCKNRGSARCGADFQIGVLT
jgi:hypothetical protein